MGIVSPTLRPTNSRHSGRQRSITRIRLSACGTTLWETSSRFLRRRRGRTTHHVDEGGPVADAPDLDEEDGGWRRAAAHPLAVVPEVCGAAVKARHAECRNKGGC